MLEWEIIDQCLLKVSLFVNCLTLMVEGKLDLSFRRPVVIKAA
jgi:hypothetical protein